MTQVEFQYNGVSTIIQCQENQKMSEICNNFISKSHLNENEINYFYDGKGGSQFAENIDLIPRGWLKNKGTSQKKIFCENLPYY